jgi:hypothetical protein
MFSSRLGLDPAYAAIALSVGTYVDKPGVFLSGLPTTVYCLWLTYITLFFLFALPRAALEIWELPSPSCMNVWFQRKEAKCDLTNTWRDHLWGSVWELLFLAGYTSALGEFSLPGREFFCLRRVFPASGAEDSRKPEIPNYSRPGRVYVYGGSYRILGWWRGSVINIFKSARLCHLKPIYSSATSLYLPHFLAGIIVLRIFIR